MGDNFTPQCVSRMPSEAVWEAEQLPVCEPSVDDSRPDTVPLGGSGDTFTQTGADKANEAKRLIYNAPHVGSVVKLFAPTVKTAKETTGGGDTLSLKDIFGREVIEGLVYALGREQKGITAEGLLVSSGPFLHNPDEYPLLGITEPVLEEYEALMKRAAEISAMTAKYGEADPAVVGERAKLKTEWDDFHAKYAKALYIYHASSGPAGRIAEAIRKLNVREFVENFKIPAEVAAKGNMAVAKYMQENFFNRILDTVMPRVQAELIDEANRLGTSKCREQIPTSDLGAYIIRMAAVHKKAYASLSNP